MEKIFLKPAAKEILYKTAEPQTHSDSFEYATQDSKTRHLGHLYVVGYLKYGEENMSYVLSLLASLAKREYFSENGEIQDDPKKAFDATLKKLNDVLDDFFKNKDFKLDLGLMAIAGGNLYISKLGKFKVLLARKDEMIDILNNVDLFRTEPTEEKQFSNIVSGKICENDKIFALHPSRSAIAREKNIKIALAQHNQEKFAAELTELSQKSKNFYCSGFHIEIQKIKEAAGIPIRSAYEKTIATAVEATAISQNQPHPINELKNASRPVVLAEQDKTVPNNSAGETAEQDKKSAKVISSEMSLIKRKSILAKFFGKFSASGTIYNSRKNRKLKVPILTVVILLIALTGIRLLWTSGRDGVFKSINENIKLAETEITQNNSVVARELLALSLVSLSRADQAGKKVEEFRDRINALLDRLDLVSDRRPELFSPAESPVAVKIAALDSGAVGALSRDKKVYKVIRDNSIEIGNTSEIKTSLVFGNSKFFSLYNGLNQFDSLNLNSKKYSAYRLKDAETAVDAAIYENNLYILSSGAIYKYTDIMSGAGEKQLWLGGLTEPGQQNIAVDGNVYVLNKDGTIIKYFKSKEESRLKLSTTPSENTKLQTNKNSSFFYLADYPAKKIRVFDKTNGGLVLTYKADNLPSLQDFSLGEDFLYLLDGDGKIWSITPN